MALAYQVVVMNQGRIEDEGSPERVYARPATRFAATFMGESTLIPGNFRNGTFRTPLGSFALPDPAMVVAIRPEHVRLGGDVEAIVRDVVYQGSFKRVTAHAAAAPELAILARLPAETRISAGERVRLGFDPSHLIPLRS